MNIEQIRQDTLGCEAVIHLNNAGASLVPQLVAKSIHEYLQAEETAGGYETAEVYQAQLDTFYDSAAQLLHANSRNMAYTTNATEAYNKALSSVPFREGDVVLISENDYPSNYISFISLQKRLGIKIVQVKNSVTGELDLNDLEKKMKKHAPKLVSVTHVPTSSGLVQPAAEIGQVIKSNGALYLLDACQSLGQLDVNAPAIQADFISGTFRKFLRGPRGAGLLYVSDEALEAGYEPLFIDLRGAEWVEEQAYQSRKDAKRFEEWERSQALVMGSTAALNYLLNLGINAVEARNAKLMSGLRNALAKIDGIQLQDQGARTSNILTFSTQKIEQSTAKEHFRKHGINLYTTQKSSALMDFAEKGIDWVVRVSPHYYNTEAELEVFADVVSAL